MATDLDLMELEDADDSKIASSVDEVYRVNPYWHLRLAYLWMQNIHFLLGDQHIYYNQVSRQFELLPTTRHNEFLPRPVTNLVQPIVQTVVSGFTRHKPTADIVPNSTKDKDISAARLAKKVQDAKWEDDDEQNKNIEAAYWAVTCGTVFRKDYWDTSFDKVVRIPMTQTVREESLDEFGNIQIKERDEPVLDEKGSPQFDEMPLGDNAVNIIDPFRMIVDPSASNEGSMNWIMETSIQKLFWVYENFDKEGDGYTGEAKKVKQEDGLSALVELRQRIKTMSGKGSGAYAGTSSGYKTEVKNSVVVKELYIRPTKKHPKGRMIVVANGKVLYKGESPYYDGIPDSWHPYSVFRYDLIPGRFWGKSLVEDLIELQRRINSIDSLVVLNRKTMIAPQRLIPHGSGVPEGYWNGAPGLQIQYRPVGANGAKPEIIPGVPLPAQAYQEREVTKNEMHQIAGTNEIMSGLRPPGVTTYGGLQLLLEQSFSKFSPLIHRWEKFIEQGQRKKLKLIAHKYREPRKEFINKLRALNKENTDIEILNFIGADLRDNTDIRIEAGSSIPRSHVAKTQQITELAQTGLLGDLINDPIAKQKFLDRIGVKGFDPMHEADFKRAQWENEMMDNGKTDKLMVLEFENHRIHKEFHTIRMKEPSFMALPPEVQEIYITHVRQHNQILQQQEIQQAQEAALAQGNLPGAMAEDVTQAKAGANGAAPPEGGEVPPMNRFI